MHTGTLKKLALALTFWLALHMSSLKAQIFTNDLPLQAVTTGTNPVDFEFRADGTLIAVGNYGVGSLGTGDQGDGTRLLWFPALGAFRAGTISTGLTVGSGPWDASNIGSYSVAFGYNNTASATGSAAFGSGSTASGENSLAGGIQCTAAGARDTALGNSTTVTGGDSFASGFYSSANGEDSVAFGGFNTASGQNSITAGGGQNTASGYCSIASGFGNTASGYASSASGYRTTAAASLSFVIGTYNVGGGDPSTWVSSDPLFEVGNGTATTPSDALVVYKDGSAAFQGPVTVAPGGDIPMYTGQ